jgi:exodeoxyribonuclease VII large subunit
MQTQNFLTVSELTAQIRNLLESNFRYVKIMAEISNFKLHQSGHFYFTLKDENAQIRAVMWRSKNIFLSFKPEDGMQVVVSGKLTVYPANGSYQLEVWELKPQGAGELQMRFEKLKQKLVQEGLFEKEHKMNIPKFPKNVVIITSKSGAVLQDFINITKRRYPALNLFLYPVNVQGYSAAREIADAIECIEISCKDGGFTPVDVIIIARGGGSLEDLWPFNDESLARVIYNCKIPTVSAVGHEIDFTICDFVADLRAPTPSAAAELVTPDINELIENISKFSYFYKSHIQNRLISLKNRLKEIRTNYYLNRPKDIISNYYQQLSDISKSINNLSTNKISDLNGRLKSYKQTLYHVNPEINLKKGYAVIFKEDNELFFNEDKQLLSFDIKNLVTRAEQLTENEEVNIKFCDKQKLAKVIK